MMTPFDRLLDAPKLTAKKRCRPSKSSSDTQVPVIDVPVIDSCVVCWESEKDVIFAPCGHRVTCSICTFRLRKAKMPCPLCRTPIDCSFAFVNAGAASASEGASSASASEGASSASAGAGASSASAGAGAGAGAVIAQVNEIIDLTRDDD